MATDAKGKLCGHGQAERVILNGREGDKRKEVEYVRGNSRKGTGRRGTYKRAKGGAQHQKNVAEEDFQSRRG